MKKKIYSGHQEGYFCQGKGFTLIELLVVLFILVTVTFVTFPSLWQNLSGKNELLIASYLKSLRNEVVATKKESFLIINFKERYFKVKTESKEKIIGMKDDETWEVFLPSSGLIKEGELVLGFSPSVNDEFLALYLNKSGKQFTVTLNYLSGEVETEEGRKSFNE